MTAERGAAASVAKRLILFFALVLASCGAILTLRTIPGFESFPLDVVYERRGFAIYLPLGACIIAAVTLTGVLRLARRRKP